MEPKKKTLRNIFLGVIACIIVYWLLHEPERISNWADFVWGLISPFVTGAVIAFILNVPMRAIERGMKFVKKENKRRPLAIVLTLLLVLVVIAGAIWLLVPQLVSTVESLVAQLPDFFAHVESVLKDFLHANPQLEEIVNNNTNLGSINWGSLIKEGLSWIGGSLSSIVGGTVSTVIGLGSGLYSGVMSLFFALYCLARKEILAGQCRKLLYAFLPEKVSDEVVRILRMANTAFSNFISGQCLEALILGSMFAVVMIIFQMPYIPLVSVTIALTALVPIVGAFVGCGVGAFFILVDNPIQAVWFIVIFLVLQQIEGNLIYPRVVGTSIGLPGMWVLVAVAIGGDLMGISGMLIMIPLASVLYALLREITTKRLAKRGVDADKLQAQPPELKSARAENRKRRKAKKEKNKSKQAQTPDQEEQ